MVALRTGTMISTNSPDLFCILVDDVDEANANAQWLKDAQASYGTNCKVTGVENVVHHTVQPSPNPTKDKIHFNGYGKLYNAIGVLVAAGINEIVLDKLSTGVYLLQVDGVIFKIVKE